MNDWQVKMFLKEVEGTYDYDKIGGGYFNVVGTNVGLFLFLDWAKKHNIWTYKVYPFCVYKNYKFKGVFCKVEDFDKVKKYVDKKFDLCLNASSPF